MLLAIMIPLSYIIGLIITRFTKEELIIRKSWLKKWPYLIIIAPLALILSPTICIIAISLINYIKASYDYIYKSKKANAFVENLIFLAVGLIVAAI